LPGELAAALVAAGGALKNVTRARTGDAGSYTYRYADLGDVLADVRPVLAEHGLAHVQLVETEPAGQVVAVRVRTMIVHTSGQALLSPTLHLLAPADPQRVGSALTYARRYSATTTLGIAGDDDDDAAAAKPRRQATQQRQRPQADQPATGRTPAEAQARQLLNAASPQVRREIQRIFRDFFGTNLSSLPVDRHDEALSFITEQLSITAEQIAEAAAERSYP
jgi:hypothetical protein